MSWPGRVSPATLLPLLWLVGVNLRTVPIGVSPLLPLIRADLGISFAEAGGLFAVPVLMMGLTAVLGGRLADRVGTWRAIATALALLGLGSGARAGIVDYPSLVAWTAVFGAGIGLAQPSLPRVVRAWYPRRRASGTGVYTLGFLSGSTLAAAVSEPLLGWLTEAG